ncbi:MAG: hypothetical protein CMQ24_21165 [Gammaproteobacteria bacterium]|nr:hypothetical protein [Gammaproteobacteria bacterium]
MANSTRQAPIDLKRMRQVVEVARAEAITPAAETLSITQSALSRSIADVENQLGVQLFHRVHRGVKLTEAGERFVARAKRLLSDIDDLIADVTTADELDTGRLRVGAAPAGYAGYTVASMRDFVEENPGVSVEMETGTPQALCPALVRGELDLIVGASAYLQRWRELELRALLPMQFACMVRKDHPLAGRNDLSELDVLQFPIVLPRSIEPMHSDIGLRYAHYGMRLQPQYVTDDFTMTTSIVSATDAFYPIMHARRSFADLEEQFHLIRDVVEIKPHDVSIAFARSLPKTRAAERFEELLATSLGLD